MRAEDWLMESSRVRAFFLFFFLLEISKTEREEGAGLVMESCASPGVCIWLRITSAKFWRYLNENAKIIGPCTAEKSGNIS